MRPIPALIAIAAIAGAGDITGAGPANAQCSVFNRHPCMPTVCSVFNRHPCMPTVCSVFRRRPCVPEIDYPLGEDLRLTIDSAANRRDVERLGPIAKPGPDRRGGQTRHRAQAQYYSGHVRRVARLLDAAAGRRGAARDADVGAIEFQAQR